MSEFGNPFEGTMPPLPVPNGPEPAPKKRGCPKGWKKPVKAVAEKKVAKAKRGGRRTGMAPNVKRKSALETVKPVTDQAPPSFAGSDNVAGLLASLDSPDVQLFFDMYRAMQPREAEDRRTIIAALQASFA